MRKEGGSLTGEGKHGRHLPERVERSPNGATERGQFKRLLAPPRRAGQEAREARQSVIVVSDSLFCARQKRQRKEARANISEPPLHLFDLPIC